MFKTFIKRHSNDGTVVETIDSKSVVLEALCAYRDNLIMSDTYETAETQTKLLALHVEINDLLDDMRK